MFYLDNLGFELKSGLPVIYFKDRMGRKLSPGQAIDKILSRFWNYILDLELLVIKWVGCIPIHTIRIITYSAVGVRIGPGAHIHTGTQFFDPKGVSIGKGTIIGQNAFLDGRARLKIGDFVDIASDVMIYNSEHDINSEDFRAIEQEVTIGDFCFIGPRAIILPGVRIGKGAVVAAGAVVTKNVDEFAIVGGVPAQVIGERNLKDPHYVLGRARLFQ